jgi:hypothetical protein
MESQCRGAQAPAQGRDARSVSVTEPVQVTLNHTAATLLARLCAETGTDNPSGLIVRALGLFEMAQRTRRQGGRLIFRNEHGDESEVAF